MSIKKTRDMFSRSKLRNPWLTNRKVLPVIILTITFLTIVLSDYWQNVITSLVVLAIIIFLLGILWILSKMIEY